MIATITGCATQQQNQVYFAAVDEDEAKPTIKFYRITVFARAINQETELITGYYKSEYLKQLFGDVVTKADDNTNSTETAKLKYFKLTPGNGDSNPTALSADDSFTVFYGANANAMSQQVNAFATSEKVGSQFGSLLAAAAVGEQVTRLGTAQAEANSGMKAAGNVAAELEKIRKTLQETTNPTQAVINGQLAQAAQAVSAAYGARAEFSDHTGKGVEKIKTERELLKARSEN